MPAMFFQFLSSAARSDWSAAETDLARIQGLRDVWIGQMLVRLYSGAGDLLATVTHETPVIDTTTDPRSLKLGAYVAETHYVNGTAAYAVLAVPGGADILRADVSLSGAISDPGGRIRLDIGATLRIYPTASLPASDGIPAAGVSPLCAFIGDSLTAQDFGVTPMYWHLGRQPKSLQPVANSGFPGRSTLGLSGAIAANSYLLATEPGLNGLTAKYGTLGWIFIRIGANDYRGTDGSAGVAITPTFKGYIDSITTDALALAEHVVWMACTPLSDASFTRKTNINSWNEYLQEIAAANPSRVHFIDDASDLMDEDGDIVAEYFQADRVHFSSAGTYQMGLTAEAAFTELLSNQTYGSPLVTSAAYVYPTVNQWNPNPTNTGTGGTFGTGWSGVCPTGMRVAGNGAGTGGTVAIVAADVGDPNQTPWVVITPTALQTGSSISISFPGSGRTISSSEPDTLEQLCEFKATSLLNCWGFDAWIQALGGLKLTKVMHFVWSPTTAITARWIGRQKLYRTNAGASGSSTTCYIYISGPTSSGSMGTFAFRNFSVEG